MPSQSVLEQKKAIVAELSERLKSSITGVVVSYEGINTEDDIKAQKSAACCCCNCSCFEALTVIT